MYYSFMTNKEFKEIRVELLRRDITFVQIAKALHTSKQMVSLSLKGKRDSDLAKKIREHVNNLLAD